MKGESFAEQTSVLFKSVHVRVLRFARRPRTSRVVVFHTTDYARHLGINDRLQRTSDDVSMTFPFAQRGMPCSATAPDALGAGRRRSSRRRSLTAALTGDLVEAVPQGAAADAWCEVAGSAAALQQMGAARQAEAAAPRRAEAYWTAAAAATGPSAGSAMAAAAATAMEVEATGTVATAKEAAKGIEAPGRLLTAEEGAWVVEGAWEGAMVAGALPEATAEVSVFQHKHICKTHRMSDEDNMTMTGSEPLRPCSICLATRAGF